MGVGLASMAVLRSHSRYQWLYNLTIKYIQRVYSPGAITQPGPGILFPHPLNNGSPSEAAQIDIDNDDILCCPTHEPSTTSSFRTISVSYINQHHAPRYAPNVLVFDGPHEIIPAYRNDPLRR